MIGVQFIPQMLNIEAGSSVFCGCPSVSKLSKEIRLNEATNIYLVKDSWNGLQATSKETCSTKQIFQHSSHPVEKYSHFPIIFNWDRSLLKLNKGVSLNVTFIPHIGFLIGFS